MSVSLPDRDPEISLRVVDVRKVRYAAVYNSVTIALATTPHSGSYTAPYIQPADHAHYTKVLEGSLVASWDDLSVQIFARPGIAQGLVTIHCAWGHSAATVPSDVDELSHMPGYTEFMFGSLSNANFTPPPSSMKLVCPFVGGIGRQTKPRELMGGYPRLYYIVFFHTPHSMTISDPTMSLVSFHASGTMSVKGTDLVI